ncbi:MAG: Gldg family protein, partial [Bacteroidota bacterium]
MKKITLISVLLVTGILLLVNVLSQRFFLRLDLTEGKQYTLSKASKDVLKSLESPVTVTAYFSTDLPPDLQKIRKDFQEMLVEYRNSSKGMVDYEFVDPGTNEDKQKEAGENGIQPVMIQVREKDQAKQQKAFLGAVVKMGEAKDAMPVVATGTGMEYALTTSIKKMAVKDKPVVAIVQGHGEPPLQELGQVYQSLSILYDVQAVDLSADTGSLERFKALAFVATADSFPPEQLVRLDKYLANGGNIFLALNRVDGDLQAQQGRPVNTGLEAWLQSKGLEVETAFVLDAQCGTVNVQQQQGFFVINTPVQFPYLPIIAAFPEHPITKGLEQVIFAFASPVKFSGTGGTFTPLIQSSDRSAIQPAPVQFDVFDKKWTAADFPQGAVTLGGILELAGGGKIVVISDGDFPVSGGEGSRGQSEDNINLMVNSIDYLSDDTGLIDLRTKGIATRPIDEAYLGDEAAGKRNLLKYLNFGLPILLVLLYGFLRNQ